eukprot:2463964-Prymnesium_polylepis.1
MHAFVFSSWPGPDEGGPNLTISHDKCHRQRLAPGLQREDGASVQIRLHSGRRACDSPSHYEA